MRTLQEAMKYGSVLIVTNAETGWIELNIDKFFPSWKEIVDQIPCQSARSTWEPTGCTMPVEWKVRSFTTEIEAFYHNKGPRVRKNIIGLGDSTSDREAILHVTGSELLYRMIFMCHIGGMHPYYYDSRLLQILSLHRTPIHTR